MIEKIKRASVAVVMWNYQGFYLTQRTGCEHYRNLWGLPGGKIRVGEATIKAAQREVLEETGLYVYERRFLFFRK